MKAQGDSLESASLPGKKTDGNYGLIGVLHYD